MTEKELVDVLAGEFKQDTFLHLILEPQPTRMGYVVTLYSEHLRAGQNEERKLFTIQTHDKEHAEMVVKKLTVMAKDQNQKTAGGIIINPNMN